MHFKEFVQFPRRQTVTDFGYHRDPMGQRILHRDPSDKPAAYPDVVPLQLICP